MKGRRTLAQLVEIKSLGGVNFVRPDRVIAVQTSSTGATVIVMEGGITVNSSEPTKVVAARLEAALLPLEDLHSAVAALSA
jgi:hypothetical protein